MSLVTGIKNTTIQGLPDTHCKIDTTSAVNGLLPPLSQIGIHTVVVVVVRTCKVVLYNYFMLALIPCQI